MTVIKFPSICVHNRIVIYKIFMIEYIIIMVISFSSKIITKIANEVNSFKNLYKNIAQKNYRTI